MRVLKRNLIFTYPVSSEAHKMEPKNKRRKLEMESKAKEGEISYQNVIETNKDKIKTSVKRGMLLDCYNYEVNEITAQKLECFFETIFLERRNAFKFNASLGIVLRNRLTGEYTYYWA